jgi:hypothetical protein
MAFPSGPPVYSDYRTYALTYDSHPVFGTAYEYRTSPFIRKEVLTHVSFPRYKSLKGRPLPHHFVIKSTYFGLHQVEKREGFAGSLGVYRTTGTATLGSIPLTWDWNGDSFLLPLDRTSLRNKCLERIFSKLNQDKANLSVDALEARETLKLLRDLTSVKKAAEKFRKAMFGNKRHRSNPKKRAAYVRDQWMQARYGIRPLISSIFDTLKALLNRHVNTSITVTGSASKVANTREYSGNGSIYAPKASLFIQGSSRCRMSATFSLSGSGIQIQDLASLNPIGWAWETIPLSFVADWFWNVGKTIENWEDWFRYRDAFVHGSITYTALEYRTLDYYGYQSRPFEYWPGTDKLIDLVYSTELKGKNVCRLVENSRELLSALPTPTGPTSNVNLNSAKVVDACAIISQLFRTTR